MTSLEDAIYALLTHAPEPADVLVKELRQWTEGKVYVGPPWQPGDVLSALDLLILKGKAMQTDKGYRLMPERKVVEKQGKMFA